MVPRENSPFRPVQKGAVACAIYFGLLFCNSENCAIF